MMTAAKKSPAFLRASLVLAATSSFLPVAFYRILSVCLLGYYGSIKRANRICQPILYIFIEGKLVFFHAKLLK
jgi:hypothetical protein